MKKQLLPVFILAGILPVLFTSCSPHASKHRMKKETILYPGPPDPPRIQYLTSISSSDNTVGRQSSFEKFVFGETTPKPVKKPYGIAVHEGKIYLCDNGIGGLDIIDLEKNTFEYFIPKGKGELKLPLNCCVGDTGTLYVADGRRKEIVIFDKEGNYINSFGGDTTFKPTDINVYDDKIYVADLGNRKIDVYNAGDFRLLRSFPDSLAPKEGRLYQPTNICVTNNKVYVSDMGDFNVKVFTHDGKYLSTVGSQGSGLGQFARPKGIAVDAESNLYVVDASFENTQIFNKEGKLLMFFGGTYNGPGGMWLPAKVTIDYDNMRFFQKYVDPSYKMKYLIFVTNQYGPDKVSIYGAIEPKEKE
jgi:DNA-binding beta-propeller fold protein YncE